MYNIWDILDCMVSEWREANDEPAKNKPSGLRLMVNTHMTVTHMLDIGRYYLKRVCSSTKSFEAQNYYREMVSEFMIFASGTTGGLKTAAKTSNFFFIPKSILGHLGSFGTNLIFL